MPNPQPRCPCVGLTELFFDRNTIDKAKAICALCEMREECLLIAVEEKLDYGVWGGSTSAERLVMRGCKPHSTATSRVSGIP